MKSSMSNEEVIDAFRDWRSQFQGGTVQSKSGTSRPLISDERIEAEIALVRKFAASIEPKLLVESTIADINAFQAPDSARRKDVLQRH